MGGGVIGQSVAWRAATAGHRVSLVDPAPGSGASRVAGGMLAPLSEAWPGEEDLLDLGRAALAHWPRFAARLTAATGGDPGLRTEGTVLVGLDSADRAELDRLAEHLAGLGHAPEKLTGRQVRALEPGIGPEVRSGLLLAEDLSVDNRAVLAELAEAGRRAGVEAVAGRAVAVRGNRIRLADGSTVDADVVVLACGAWSAGLHPSLHAVRPVKGEVLRLRARPSALPPPQRTVRALVQGRPSYLVPRAGGGLVLGATQYEAGHDTEVTVAGVRDLLRDAERVLPGIAEYALVECAAGLRPGTPDNLPLIGWLEPGLVVATGHHRNGFLLAPITAEAVLALLDDRPPPAPVLAADPHRLALTREPLSGVSR
nr:glycine oxidase ThiO [Goodfellowiella coeruleoviolacea]